MAPLAQTGGARVAPPGLLVLRVARDPATTVSHAGAVDDTWAGLADQFVDEAYASVKGYVRTYVLHEHLLEHLPAPPAAVLDVGGGAGHQSFPLARAGYEVTILDSSEAMLDKGRERLKRLPAEAQGRVTFVEGKGEEADEAVGGRRFAAVLCQGVLGVPGRADTVEELSELLKVRGVEPMCWYGVWLFVDWFEFSGVGLDPSDSEEVAKTAAVELEASRRDPYRQLSRVFHLVGRKGRS